MDYVELSNGIKMPMLGFGVFQVPDGDICGKAALVAELVMLAETAVYVQ